MASLYKKIKLDAKRYGYNKLSFFDIIYYFYIMPVPGLKFLTIFRATQHYRRKSRVLFYFYFIWLRKLRYKYGFDISHRTQLGEGFYIGHFGCIIIHGDTVFGKNCNVSHGITIGQSNYGKNIGVPKFGENVFIGPGACVFGKITIGNNVTIGANTVVSDNLPDNTTVIPTKGNVIEKDMSSYYVYNKI